MFKRLIFSSLFLFVFVSFSHSEDISGDIFGKQRKHIHPAIGIEVQYTDNLYNSNKDRESDISSIISPSIALAAPGTNKVDIVMNTDTAAPGGLAMSRDRIDSTERYLAYLVYNPKAEYYIDNSDENSISHSLKTALQYNARGGLSVDFAGRYSSSRESRGEVGNRYAEEYDDLLFDFIINQNITSKTFVNANFSSFDVNYDRKDSEFRNRADISWALSAGYKFSPKTEISFQYRNVDIDYDKDQLDDNDEKIFSLNLKWNITSKSRGKFKIGQSKKSLDSGEEADELITEAELLHYFTTRTSVSLAASRKFYETNLPQADFYTSDRLIFIYSQEFSSKIKGKLNLAWSRDDYSGIDLTNDFYQFNPSVDYDFSERLKFECGYSYETRSSDFDVLEYDTNKFYLSFNGQF